MDRSPSVLTPMPVPGSFTVTVSGAVLSGICEVGSGQQAITVDGFATPGDWNTKAVTGKTPGVEPLNVIISAESTVPVAEILSSMTDTGPQGTEGWGQAPACTSAEDADISGEFALPQEYWRLGGDCPPATNFLRLAMRTMLASGSSQSKIPLTAVLGLSQQVTKPPVSRSMAKWFRGSKTVGLSCTSFCLMLGTALTEVPEVLKLKGTIEAPRPSFLISRLVPRLTAGHRAANITPGRLR